MSQEKYDQKNFYKEKYGNKKLKQIIELYKQGETLTDLGKKIGVGRHTVKKILKIFGTKIKDKVVTKEAHIERLKKFNRVILVGEWKGSQEKTAHKCLIHNEVYDAFPNNVGVKGLGLRCCHREGVKLSIQRQNDAAKKAYDAKIKLASKGKIQRIEEYVNSKTPILHRCNEHNEEHKSRPEGILQGDGLYCCRVAWSHKQATIRNDKARNAYDEKLKIKNRFKRIEEYIDATTPILHLCLSHNEEHKNSPNQLTNTGALPCCNTGHGWDTLENILEERQLAAPEDRPTDYYIFKVPKIQNWFKVGISVDTQHRKRARGSELYGDHVCSWQLSTRRNAILVETSILRDDSFKKPLGDIDVGHLEGIEGFSELRGGDEKLLVEYVSYLVDSLESDIDDWKQWALENIPNLRTWEIKKLKQ